MAEKITEKDLMAIGINDPIAMNHAKNYCTKFSPIMDITTIKENVIDMIKFAVEHPNHIDEMCDPDLQQIANLLKNKK